LVRTLGCGILFLTIIVSVLLFFFLSVWVSLFWGTLVGEVGFFIGVWYMIHRSSENRQRRLAQRHAIITDLESKLDSKRTQLQENQKILDG